MMPQTDKEATDRQYRTSAARIGDRALIIERLFDAPPDIVFMAWGDSDLFRRWWMPKSVSGVSLSACDMDVRTGGKYRLEMSVDDADAMTFYGRYIDVVPNERIVWTNDEEDDGAITTVTFQKRDGRTLLTFHEIYPSAEALEEAMQGSAAGRPEQLDQLAALLHALGG
ncbi:MAG: SRPBCC domain-containing protein [Sphingomonas bacterium]|nr:SRPBCC domain-containing protein [Sphingomonas bacterium]